MIFRRFLQRLRQHHWGAIATELAIVIVGVFIGMQVTNWNEERETSQKAKVFTARLIDDLRREAWSYAFLIEYNRDINRNQRRVLDAMAGELELSDEQFVIAAYRGSQYKYNDRYRATYDEMVSTGTIGLIADQTLRETAISVFTTPLMDLTAQEANRSEYRRLFRETVSAEVQQALLADCGDRYAPVLDYVAIRGSIDYPCNLQVAPGKLHAAAMALKAAPRLVQTLQIRFADTQTALTDLQVANQVVWQRLQAMREDKP
jgi:hypothetical protein